MLAAFATDCSAVQQLLCLWLLGALVAAPCILAAGLRGEVAAQ